MLQHTLGRADCGHFKIASEKEWPDTEIVANFIDKCNRTPATR